MSSTRRRKFAFVGILTSVFLSASFVSRADAEIKTHFDLPAEALDKALRDFAVQAHCNVSYEPSVVAGLRAPVIKGDFTAADALAMLLVGTRLSATHVDENTIRVV